VRQVLLIAITGLYVVEVDYAHLCLVARIQYLLLCLERSFGIHMPQSTSLIDKS